MILQNLKSQVRLFCPFLLLVLVDSIYAQERSTDPFIREGNTESIKVTILQQRRGKMVLHLTF
jgi:hypothetical protein